MAETPQSIHDTGSSWGHNLSAVPGRFSDLVWECIDCGERRTKKQFFKDVDCAADAAE